MLYGILFVLGLVTDYSSPFVLYRFIVSRSTVRISQHLYWIVDVLLVQERAHFIDLQHSPWLPIGETSRYISLTFSIVYASLFSEVQKPVILHNELLKHLFQHRILNLKLLAGVLHVPKDHGVLPGVALVAFIRYFPMFGILDLGMSQLLIEYQRHEKAIVSLWVIL